MKAFVFSFKFLILSLTVLPSALCSNDDDNPEEGIVFNPVSLSLIGLDIDVVDTNFSVDGYDFTAFRTKSYEDTQTYGLLLAFPPDGNPSWVELDLSDAEGLSKITASVSDYGGGTSVVLMHEGQSVEEVKDIPNDPSDITISLNGRQIDALRITSIEGDVNNIKLE